METARCSRVQRSSSLLTCRLPRCCAHAPRPPSPPAHVCQAEPLLHLPQPSAAAPLLHLRVRRRQRLDLRRGGGRDGVGGLRAAVEEVWQQATQHLAPQGKPPSCVQRCGPTASPPAWPAAAPATCQFFSASPPGSGHPSAGRWRRPFKPGARRSQCCGTQGRSHTKPCYALRRATPCGGPPPKGAAHAQAGGAVPPTTLRQGPRAPPPPPTLPLTAPLGSWP